MIDSRKLAIVATCALGILAGCGLDEGSVDEPALRPVQEAERYGGTAVVGGRASIGTLNPLVSTDFEAAQLQKHALFTTLVRYDGEASLTPYLAESWELNRDSTQIVFRLRRDVSWHDGSPTTARDVAFTFGRVKDPNVAFPNRGWFDLWEAAEVVDPHTIRFVLRPHADFMFGWSQLPIVPEHVLRDVPPDELTRHPFGTDELVGNGPFRFSERTADAWSFVANPEFPDELGGRPYLERLVYRVVPDPTTLLAELRTGAVHIYLDLPPSQIETATADADIEVITRPSRSYTFIAWNSRRAPFGDPVVRSALTLAIDREQLVAAVRNGLGTVTAGPLGPWHWAYDPSAAPLPFAPDSAGGLLDRAGWRDADADGVRERDGEELRFEIVTNPNPVRQDIAVIVQSQLAAVGVAAEPRTMESAALGAAVTSPERRYDAAILGFEQDWVLDDRDLWACERIGQPWQFTSYCDPDLDLVLDSLPRALERGERRRLYRRYNDIVRRDQPFTFLFFETVADGVRRELGGLELDARGELASVRGWWIHPDGR
jgi:peptide/nickel transport system substrate-binding protein